MQKIQGIYQSSFISSKSVIHGFSTKAFGDIRVEQNRGKFFATLAVPRTKVVWQEQVHANVCHVVTPKDHGQVMPHVDGLVANRKDNPDGVYLAVHTADCVPVLLIDPLHEVIGACHSGWRGTVQHITRKVIQEMVELGASVEDIRVLLGPHIGPCCYDIDPMRVSIFSKEFGDFVLSKNASGAHMVSLSRAIENDCKKEGILSSHFDTDPRLCTYDNPDDFYSYRRSGKPLDGEIAGIIGIK